MNKMSYYFRRKQSILDHSKDYLKYADDFKMIRGYNRYLISPSTQKVWDTEKLILLTSNDRYLYLIGNNGKRRHCEVSKLKPLTISLTEEIKRRSSIRESRDINFKIRSRLRNRMYQAIKNNVKSGSAVKDLGCSMEYFKQYIEEQFTDGMTWDNYGEWHLDHKIPLTWFNLQDREEFRYAAFYLNYQPLWGRENIKKSNKFKSN